MDYPLSGPDSYVKERHTHIRKYTKERTALINKFVYRHTGTYMLMPPTLFTYTCKEILYLGMHEYIYKSSRAAEKHQQLRKRMRPKWKYITRSNSHCSTFKRFGNFLVHLSTNYILLYVYT